MIIYDLLTENSETTIKDPIIVTRTLFAKKNTTRSVTTFRGEF